MKRRKYDLTENTLTIVCTIERFTLFSPYPVMKTLLYLPDSSLEQDKIPQDPILINPELFLQSIRA